MIQVNGSVRSGWPFAGQYHGLIGLDMMVVVELIIQLLTISTHESSKSIVFNTESRSRGGVCLILIVSLFSGTSFVIVN